MHMGDMGVWGWSMMVIPTLLWIGILALLASNAWAAVRPRSQSATPLDLLKETYARGQITHEQFEQMKKDLA